MGKVIAYLAMSIDGYIATLDDKIDWLEAVEGEGDNGYNLFYDSIDYVVMGRSTYEWIDKHMGDYPYADKQSYVFSRTAQPAKGDIQFMNRDIHTFIKELAEQDAGDIWIVGGGQIVTELVKHQLIDRYIITIAPVVLGDGIPLFVKGEYQQKLKLVETEIYNQFVQVVYEK